MNKIASISAGLIIGLIGTLIIFPTSEWIAKYIVDITEGTTIDVLFEIIFGILYFLLLFLFIGYTENKNDKLFRPNGFYAGLIGLVGFIILRAIFENAIFKNIELDNTYYYSSLCSGTITFAIIYTINELDKSKSEKEE